MSAEDTLSLLTQVGSYDTAFSFAIIFRLPIEGIFGDLVMKCVTNSGNEAALLKREELRPLVVWSDTMLSSADGKESERMWKLLQCYLGKFDSEVTQFRYHKLVVEKILSSERGVSLPTWILRPYKLQPGEGQTQASPSDLLKAYVRYDMINEAYDYAISMIEARTQLVNKVMSRKIELPPRLQWLPYTIFDQLQHVLQDKRATPQLQNLKVKLEELFNATTKLTSLVHSQKGNK